MDRHPLRRRLGDLWFDFISVPDCWRLGLGLRLFLFTPLFVLSMRYLRPGQPRWLETLASVASPVASIWAVQVLFASSEHYDPLRSALALGLMTMWMTAVVPLRTADAVAFICLSVAGGDAVIAHAVVTHAAPLVYPAMIAMSHMMILMAFIGRMAAARSSRRGFRLGVNSQMQVQELSRANASLRTLATTDALTGLPNRRHFDERMGQAWRDAAAARGRVAVAMVDVDHFKLFNDSAGHPAGDACLATLARCIAAQARQSGDTAARYGGEEFVLLMPGADHAAAAAAAAAAAERLRAAVAALRLPHPGRGGRHCVSVSIGVAAGAPGQDAASAEVLLAAADQALYEAKQAGRNRVATAWPGRHAAEGVALAEESR